MHVWHTGKREMLTSGASQRRQSEGKKAAKRPREIVAVAESAQFSRRRTSNRPALTPGDVPAATRIMSPVLLKTCLPRPAPAWAPAGRIVLSIAGSCGASNYSGCCSWCHFRFVPALPNGCKRRGTAFYGNIWRSEPAAETVSAKCIFPGNSGAGTDTLPNRRSQDIETGWRTWFTPPNLSGRPKPSGSLIIAKGHT